MGRVRKRRQDAVTLRGLMRCFAASGATVTILGALAGCGASRPAASYSRSPRTASSAATTKASVAADHAELTEALRTRCVILTQTELGSVVMQFVLPPSLAPSFGTRHLTGPARDQAIARLKLLYGAVARDTAVTAGKLRRIHGGSTRQQDGIAGAIDGLMAVNDDARAVVDALSSRQPGYDVASESSGNDLVEAQQFVQNVKTFLQLPGCRGRSSGQSSRRA